MYKEYPQTMRWRLPPGPTWGSHGEMRYALTLLMAMAVGFLPGGCVRESSEKDRLSELVEQSVDKVEVPEDLVRKHSKTRTTSPDVRPMVRRSHYGSKRPKPRIAFIKPHFIKGPLLFSYDFESSSLDDWDMSWLFLKSSAKVVPKPVRCGKRALWIRLRRADPMRSKGKRSELAVPYVFSLAKDYWVGFSVFLPEDWKEDFQGDVVTQFFATEDRHLGERPRSPALALRIKKGSWVITNRYDPSPVTVSNSAPQRIVWQGRFRRRTWTDWAFHLRFSFKEDGLIEVYKNKKLLTSARGPNTYNDEVGPIMKMGVYKAPWNDPSTPSATSIRVIYFDEVRIGTFEADLAKVSPGCR